MSNEPPVEYASVGMRTESRGQVSAVQRQRIAYLMQLEASHNGVLSKADRDELTVLQKLAGISPTAPLNLVNRWAAGLLGASIPNSMQRNIPQRDLNRRRQLELLRMRWGPEPQLTPRQKIVALWRERMDWDLSPRQRQLQRMKDRWAT